MKRYKMQIEILSPVHIGSGEQIDPLEYVIDEAPDTDGARVFYRLDIAGFLSGLDASQKNRFNEALKSNRPLMMREFLAREIKGAALEKFTLFRVDTGPSFEEAYSKSRNDMNNQLLVELFPRCGFSQQAYLPGSSIKGSIRTAVVSQLAEPGIDRRLYTNRQGKLDRGSGVRLEQKILGYHDAKQDPFKMLRITDAFLPPAATFIDRVQIYNPARRQGPDPAGIKMFYEQCFSMLDGEHIVAGGILEINDDLVGKKGVDKSKKPVNAVSRPLTAEQIARSCRDFYRPKMEDEHENFYCNRNDPDLEKHSDRLLDVEYADLEFPVRIGRFSHVECHTLDGYRQPKTRRGWGKTRMLSDGRMPMGWAKISLAPCG